MKGQESQEIPNEKNQINDCCLNSDINPNKLKEFKGFENITDEQALKICAFTIQYCSMIYESITYFKTSQRNEQSNPRFSKIC